MPESEGFQAVSRDRHVSWDSAAEDRRFSAAFLFMKKEVVPGRVTLRHNCTVGFVREYSVKEVRRPALSFERRSETCRFLRILSVACIHARPAPPRSRVHPWRGISIFVSGYSIERRHRRWWGPRAKDGGSAWFPSAAVVDVDFLSNSH